MAIHINCGTALKNGRQVPSCSDMFMVVFSGSSKVATYRLPAFQSCRRKATAPLVASRSLVGLRTLCSLGIWV